MAEELRIVIDDAGAGATAPATGPVTPSAPALPQPTAPARGPSAPEEKKKVFDAVSPRLEAAAARQAAGRAAIEPAIAVAGQAGAGGAAASVARVTAALGPLGIAVGVATLGFAAAAVATRKFARTVEEQVSLLAGVSGPVAQAQAETEIRREFALLRRAQRIGPDLAQSERTRAKFEEALFDVNTEILSSLLKIVNIAGPVTDRIAAGISLAAEQQGLLTGGLLGALANAAGPFGVIFKAAQVYVQSVEDDDRDSQEEFTRRFMRQLPRDEDNQPLFWPDDLSQEGTF